MNTESFQPMGSCQGWIQDFKLGGGVQLKKIVLSGGRHENFWGISCEKSRFYAKNHIFFNFRGPVPPGCFPVIFKIIYISMYVLYILY